VKEAAEINKRMVPLANSLFIETNPIPVKAAVTLVTGIDAGAPRLPLTPMTEGALEKMKVVLKENGLI
ncbi:MAG: dihydrodipicolinate synthase family protein, partial [Acidaminococcaceae bacterium]|nr:dihydrodipicolinate synthase family protein [Acidaminococcaceae bacterium]